MRKDIRRRLVTLLGVVILTGLAIWVDIPKHPHFKLGSVKRDLNVKLGLDLQGGTHLVYRANIKDIGSDQITDAMAGVRDVIERRVNAFGISEPIVQTDHTGSEYRVIVELAGVHDPQEAIKQIGETPQLDFRREVGTEEALKQFHIDNPAKITGPIFERTQLTGKQLKRATVTFDQTSNTPQVDLEFDSEGANLFAELTKQNLGKRIAIYLDAVPISAPVVQSEITNGRAVISGGFSLDEAKQLAQRLNAGALPVPIELISQTTIGPSLGKLSIRQSLVASYLGLLAVILWMIIYYRLPGVIAAVALVMYALFFLALVKLIPVTLTLAGVAGFIMSIGMAVDTNILIFERFRENLRRGYAVLYALTDGFREAWDSIRDSHVFGIIAGIILYTFGTSIVRGFAVTFTLGVLLSLFTALTISRSLLFIVLQSQRTHKPLLLAVTAIKTTPKK